VGEWASIKDIKRHFGVCEMTVYRWLKQDGLEFPRPIRINNRRYWRWDDVRDFEAKCNLRRYLSDGENAANRKMVG
jgi:predicted DNA-binding transcriptional regulator AlpA